MSKYLGPPDSVSRSSHSIEAVAVAASTADKVLAHYAYSHLMTLFWWDAGDDEDDVGGMSKYLGPPDTGRQSCIFHAPLRHGSLHRLRDGHNMQEV